MIAEREDVGSLVDRLSFRLFRRHVGDGSDDAPVAGERRGRHAGLGDEPRVFLQLCQAEVEDLDPAVARDHHVGGLEIAVRDAALVRGADGVSQRDREVQHPIERQAALGNEVGKRLAVDQLEGQKRNAVRLFNRVNGDDVRMIEGGGGQRLALEPFAAIAIAGELARQHLYRDSTLQAGIVGEVDLAHTAFPEQFH